jgi:hypothetical protein
MGIYTERIFLKYLLISKNILSLCINVYDF